MGMGHLAEGAADQAYDRAREASELLGLTSSEFVEYRREGFAQADEAERERNRRHLESVRQQQKEDLEAYENEIKNMTPEERAKLKQSEKALRMFMEAWGGSAE